MRHLSPTAHIFLVAGQSNSVGYNVDPFTPEDGPNPRILQLQCCTANLTSLPPSQCFLNISADPLQPCDSGAHVSFARSFSRSLLAGPGQPAQRGCGVPGADGHQRHWIRGRSVAGVHSGTGFKAAIAMLRRTWQLLHEDKLWQR